MPNWKNKLSVMIHVQLKIFGLVEEIEESTVVFLKVEVVHEKME